MAADGSIILETTVDTEGLKSGTKSLAGEAAKLAATYRKAGMSQSDAMKKAWSEIERVKKETGLAEKATKKWGKTTRDETKSSKNAVVGLGISFKSLAGIIATAFSIRKVKDFFTGTYEEYKESIENETKLATVMRNTLSATDDEIQGLLDLADAQEKIGVVSGDAQASALAELASFVSRKEALEDMLPVMNDYIAYQYGYTASTEQARNVATALGKAINGSIDGLAKQGFTLNQTDKEWFKTANEAERVAFVMDMVSESMGGVNAALGATETGKLTQLKNEMGNVKAQFGAAVSTIQMALLPALQVAAKWFMYLALYVREFVSVVSKLFGGVSKEQQAIADATETQAKNISTSTKNEKELEKAVKKTGAAAKKAVAPFFEMNLLIQNSAETQQDMADDLDLSGIDGGGFGFGGDFGIQKAETLTEDIRNIMSKIMLIVGGALLALGAILTFTGANIGLGLALMVTGALMTWSALALNWDSIRPKIEKFLKEYGVIIAAALAVIGVILLFTGVGIGLGIAMIIAGAALFGVTKSGLDWNKFKQQVIDALKEYGVIVGGALLVLGVLLCLSGVGIALGIAMIVAGVGVLGVTALTLGWDELKNQIISVFQDYGAVIAGIGAALLIIGIILCLTGALLPLGIGLIVAGAGLLGTAIVVNWDWLKNKVVSLFEEHGAIMAGIGAALLIIGIILCFTGVGVGLGIGLILGGAGILGTAIAYNWDYLKNKIGGFFDEYKILIDGALIVIGLILCFTGAALPLGLGLLAAGAVGLATASSEDWDAFKGQFKSSLDWCKKQFSDSWSAMKQEAEIALMGIQRAIKDKLTGTTLEMDVVPQVVDPETGRASGGARVSRVKNVPKYAQGTVIRPNNPHKAIVGDNTREPEIISPLSTMMEAVARVTGQQEQILRDILSVLRLMASAGNSVSDTQIAKAISQILSRYNATNNRTMQGG